jgi:hypothetical protein
VQKNHNSAFPNFGIIALCSIFHFELCPEHSFETIRGINKNCVAIQISLNRSAVKKNRSPDFSNFSVAALCTFLHFELFPGHNSNTIRDINI